MSPRVYVTNFTRIRLGAALSPDDFLAAAAARVLSLSIQSHNAGKGHALLTSNRDIPPLSRIP